MFIHKCDVIILEPMMYIKAFLYIIFSQHLKNDLIFTFYICKSEIQEFILK